MLSGLKRSLRGAVEQRLDGALVDRIDALKAPMGARINDDFGLDPEQIKMVIPVVEFFYRHWFRVETFGLRDMPAGRVLFVANHSGQVPIDAMMVASSLLLDGDPPRAVRSMIERWVPTLPFVSTFFARLGQVLGTPENCRRLLRQEEAVLVFPEGVRGINKTYDHAYQLQDFGHGFMRLALETGTPIVPVAVVGAEEQYPTIWNAKSVARLLGLPAVPIAPTMFVTAGLPLPVKYRIYFGRPMTFEGDPDDDETVVGAQVGQVKDAIAALLDRGLREREHIFW
ncbi:MAG: acyltransferase family protein [Myxococcales bacterium]|nr:acyltransferase family protein [Myxococcales bacterium]